MAAPPLINPLSMSGTTPSYTNNYTGGAAGGMGMGGSMPTPTAGGGTGAPTGTPLPGATGGSGTTTSPGSPYASGFAGGSTDPNVFTTPDYIKNLNQNSMAWMSNQGQAPAFSQNQFNQAWQSSGMNDPSAWLDAGFGSSPSEVFAKQMGLGGNVTALEQANHSSNLWQTPQVQAGQPYQHFMQGLNFGNGVQNNPGNNTPTGYNNWNPNGAAQTPGAGAPQGGGQIPTPGQPPGSGPISGGQPQQPQPGSGAYGGFQAPQGMAQAQSGSSPGQGGFNPAQGNYNWSSPVAGGYNAWGNPLMGNPYAYMTGQPNNGLNGGSIYAGSQPGSPNMWSPYGANMAQGYPNTNGSMPNFNTGFQNQNVPTNGMQGASNPLGGAGNMGNFSQLMNAIMGMFGGI